MTIHDANHRRLVNGALRRNPPLAVAIGRGYLRFHRVSIGATTFQTGIIYAV
jgi:hypothetical protein